MEIHQVDKELYPSLLLFLFRVVGPGNSRPYGLFIFVTFSFIFPGILLWDNGNNISYILLIGSFLMVSLFFFFGVKVIIQF